MLRAYFQRPPVVLELALLAALLSAAIIVLMAIGSAQVLSDAGSEALPMVYLILAAVSVPLASGISAALCRWSVAGISTASALASAVLALALRAALGLSVPGAALAVCVAAYALEIIFDSLFWLSASEHLPTLELKRHTPFLAGAFGLGGIVAGFLATAFCTVFAGEDLLLLDAAFFAACVIQYRRLSHFRSVPEAIEGGEAEPGIVEALKATVGVVRTFPVTAALAASVLLMSALFCLQDYLAMTAFQQQFPDPDALSGFMAMLYAAHQGVELLVLAGCGRLILEWAGPVGRNMVFPATTLAGLAALLGFGNLAAAVFVHANVIALSNAVFEPVKTLNFAALPYRVLAQVRMLVDGLVYPLGIAVSAGALLWLQQATSPSVILGVAIVVGLLFAGVSTLVGSLFLPSLLRSLRLRAISPTEYARAGSGRMFSAGDIRRLINHPDATARGFGIDLAQRLAPELLPAADASGQAPSPAAAGVATLPPEITVALREEDFAAVGESGVPIVPGRRRRSARTRQGDADASAATVGHDPTPARLSDLGRALEHSSLATRRAAAGILGRLGDAALPIAEAYLLSERPEVAEAAIQALGGMKTRRAQQLLRNHLRPLYRRARANLKALKALERIPDVSDEHRRAMAIWLVDSNRAITRRALAVKSALGNPRDIKLLDALTRAREPRTRSGAIEALVNLPTKRFIQPLVPVLEAGADPGGCSATAGGGSAGAAVSLRDAVTDDPWARLLVTRLIDSEQGDDDAMADEAMLDLVLFLKTTSLFRAIPLEDVARVVRLAEPLAPGEGDWIAQADDALHHIYVVRSGTVEVRLDGATVETLGRAASFGEGAVFGEERHAASFRAGSPVLLLRFPASMIADLVAENPEALGLIALDLSARLNRLRGQLAAASGSATARGTSELPHASARLLEGSARPALSHKPSDQGRPSRLDAYGLAPAAP